MFSLVLSVRTFENLIILLALFLVFYAWSYYLLKKNAPLSLAFPIALQLAIFLVYLRIVGLNHDESEHLHCAWLMGQGLVPFRDFWQHHAPLLWLILAPLMRVFKPSSMIFEVSRLFSLGIFTLCIIVGWRIAKKAWGVKAHLPSYLLVVCSATIYGEYFRIRPDLFMTLFLLVGVEVSLAIPQGRMFSVFIAGVCMALAQSFVCKQYLVAAMPVLALLVFRDKISFLRGVCVYALGIAVGCAPLALYLLANGITKDFFYWVFTFNGGRINFGTVLPLAITLVGVWGAVRLLQAYRRDKDPHALMLVMAFWLSTASCFTGMVSGGAAISPREGYYQQFWIMMCAVAASGGMIFEIVATQKALFRKAAVAGVLCALLAAGNAFYAIPERKSFAKDKQAVARLIKYAQGDSCVMILPVHPIFCFDGTRIYSYWQYVFCGVYPAVLKDAKAHDVARSLLAHPPAVVLAELDKRDFMLDLFLRGLITKADYRPLKAMFEEKYTVKNIGVEKYYVRNDRLQEKGKSNGNDL